MVLDFLNAFRLPFCSQTFGFFSFADGAITLSAISAIKRMPVAAMRLLRIDVANGSRITLGIFRCRYGIEMLRIHTGTIPAGVIHDETFRNRSSGKEQSNAMRFSRRSTKRDDAVSVAILMVSPYEAIAAALNLGVKSVDFLLRWFRHRKFSGWLASTAYPVTIVKVSLCSGN